MKILFVIPGDINLPTGGYRYDREIIRKLRTKGHAVQLLQLDGDYPFPTEKHKRNALKRVHELADFDVSVVDGLAGGGHPEFLESLGNLRPVVSLVHHPLCLENGLSKAQKKALKHSEARSLKHASAIVTTSPKTAKTVSKLFDISKTQVFSVLPGVERLTRSTPHQSGTINLLCVGSIIERKGHRDLIGALEGITHLDWHLDCAGSAKLDANLSEEVRALVDEHGLTDRIEFHGAVEPKKLAAMYEKAHVFVLPSLYEGYGMAYVEAIVAGLPVIGTTGGAIPDTVPKNCGVLIEPGDVSQLQDALEIMITDERKRESFRLATQEAAAGFPDWCKSAKQFSRILEDLVTRECGQ